MRWSPEKLRWLLLAGALSLAVALAALLGLAKYRAGKIWQKILARNGVNLRQETDGYTYSQSDGKRTVFTLHAAKAVPHGDGNWTLQDAVLVLYTKDGRTDRIYGSQFQYDGKAGVARAVGEVRMDLEAPSAAGTADHAEAHPPLSFTGGDEESADPALIHVRTSGLVYMRKLDVAATDQPTEFRYEDLLCTSRGAEFDSGQNLLRLLAEVHMTGRLRDAPFTLTAARADLDRAANTADLVQPFLVSGQRSARASHALLHLRKDGSLERGDAEGGVDLREAAERVSAPQMHAEFGAGNRPQHAVLSGGVSFAGTDPLRPTQGSANTADLRFAPSGLLQTLVADGRVEVRARLLSASGAGAGREAEARSMTATFVPAGDGNRRSILQRLDMLGGASVTGDSPAGRPGAESSLTRVSADDLKTAFVAGAGKSAEPQHTVGTGHTELQQVRGDGAHDDSTGEALQIQFSPRSGPGTTGAMEVSSAVQTGDVALHSWPAATPAPTSPATPAAAGVAKNAAPAAAVPTTGRAFKAVFSGADGTLTLTGSGEARDAFVDSGDTQLRAPQIVLHQGTGDAEASGGVVATTAGADESQATHVVAARERSFRKAQISQFFGTDANPAQLWQGGSQVRAAKISLDGLHHTLSARPEQTGGAVNAVFASQSQPSGGHPVQRNPVAPTEKRLRGEGPAATGGRLPEASRDAVEVRAAAMDYNDAQHEAVFGGEVRMVEAAGEITGEHGAAFLQPAPAARAPGGGAGTRSAPPVPEIGGRLERLVVEGDVRLRQPGRTGTGEQLTYTAASNDYVLTGTPSVLPRVQDRQQGTVTGATLLFGAADSSIVVAGGPARGKGATPVRVHTETDLKPQ